jgi:hypothetical protein
LFDESPRPLRQAVSGLEPEPRLPGIRLTPRPREPKPTPGTVAFPLATPQSGSLMQALFDLRNRAPPLAAIGETNPGNAPSRHSIARHLSPFPTRLIGSQPTRRGPPQATSIPARESHLSECRAARSHKNLNQVLKNMDSPCGKSTIQTSPLHFVSNSRRAQAFRSKRPLVLMMGINKPSSRHNPMILRMRPRMKPCSGDDSGNGEPRNVRDPAGSPVAHSRGRCYTEGHGNGQPGRAWPQPGESSVRRRTAD